TANRSSITMRRLRDRSGAHHSHECKSILSLLLSGCLYRVECTNYNFPASEMRRAHPQMSLTLRVFQQRSTAEQLENLEGTQRPTSYSPHPPQHLCADRQRCWSNIEGPPWVEPVGSPPKDSHVEFRNRFPSIW